MSVPILIYNGQDDLIVQSAGTMKWVEKLQYRDSQKFLDTDFSVWKVDNEVVGSKKSAGLLSFYIVNNAGHMVPMDSPKAALNMASSFINKYK